jgi:hypothetical protein
MAINYSINPYQGGAVVFDQRPYAAFFERQMAKQQAKDEAMNGYFQNLNKNITPAGMRSQDVPMLLKKQQEWNQLAMQNKTALLDPKKDGGQTLGDYQSRYNDMLGYIQQSKDAMKTMDQVGKLRLNSQMSHVAEDPTFMNQIQKHELPIGDPDREGLNLATIALPPKPLDTKDWESYNKYLTGNIGHDKIPGKTENIGDFKTRTPIHAQFSPENQKVIGEHAMNAYDTDKRWRLEAVKVFNELKSDPVAYDKYNTLFKSLYGNDIDDPKEAWAAKGILDNNMKATEYKLGEDTYGKSKALAALNHNYRTSEILLRDSLKGKDDVEQNDKMDELYDGIKGDALKTPKVYKPANGTPYKQYEIKATTGLKKVFAVPDAKGHLVYPDALRFSGDFGTVTPIFFEHYGDGKGGSTPDIVKDKNGNASVRDLGTPLKEDEFKERWKKEIMGAGAYGKSLNKKSTSKGAAKTSTNDPLGIF